MYLERTKNDTLEKLINLLKKYKKGSEPLEVVFLIGAGMSNLSGIPTTNKITHYLREFCYISDIDKSLSPFDNWPSYEYIHSELLRILENKKQNIQSFSDWAKDKYHLSSEDNLPESDLYFHVLRDAADNLITQKFRGHPALEGLREEKLAEFFQVISVRAKPCLGYHMLAKFLEQWHPCFKVLTTNFDKLIAITLQERGLCIPYPRPWNERAYYDTPIKSSRKCIDIYYLHGDRGTARVLQPSLGATAITEIKKAFYQIGTSTKKSILIVLGYGGRDDTIFKGLEALIHPRVFSEGVWWQVRYGSSIEEELTERLEGELFKKQLKDKFKFFRYQRVDLLLQELCDRVFNEPLEPIRLAKKPYRFLVPIHPPESKHFDIVRPSSILAFAKKRAEPDSLSNLQQVNMYVICGEADLPSRVAADLVRDRKISGNFDVCWCDLEECSNPSLLLPFIANSFSQLDPQSTFTPLFRGDLNQNFRPQDTQREIRFLVEHMRTHKYLMIFDGLSHISDKNDRDSLLEIIRCFCDLEYFNSISNDKESKYTNLLGQSWCILTVSRDINEDYSKIFGEWNGILLQNADCWVKERLEFLHQEASESTEPETEDEKELFGAPSKQIISRYLNRLKNCDNSQIKAIAAILAHMRRPRGRAAVRYVAQKLSAGDDFKTQQMTEDFYSIAPQFGIELAEGGYLWLPFGLREAIKDATKTHLITSEKSAFSTDNGLLGGYEMTSSHLAPNISEYVHEWLSGFYQIVFQASGDPEALVEAIWHLEQLFDYKTCDQDKTTSQKENHKVVAVDKITSLLKAHRNELIRYGHLRYMEELCQRMDKFLKQTSDRLVFDLHKTIKGITSLVRRDLTDWRGAIKDQIELLELSLRELPTNGKPTEPEDEHRELGPKKKLQDDEYSDSRQSDLLKNGFLVHEMLRKYNREDFSIDVVRAIVEIGRIHNGNRQYSKAFEYYRQALDVMLSNLGSKKLRETEKKVWSTLAAQCYHRMVSSLILRADYSHAKFVLKQGRDHLGPFNEYPPILPIQRRDDLHAFAVLQTHSSELYRLEGNYTKARQELQLAQAANAKLPWGDEIGDAVCSIHNAMIELEDILEGDCDLAAENINNALDILPQTRHNIWWWTHAEVVHARTHMALAKKSQSLLEKIRNLKFAEKAIDRAEQCIVKDDWRRLECKVARCELALTYINLKIPHRYFPHSDDKSDRSVVEKLDTIIKDLSKWEKEAIKEVYETHYLLIAKISYLLGQCYILRSKQFSSVRKEKHNEKEEHLEDISCTIEDSINEDEDNAVEHFRFCIQLLHVLGLGNARYTALEQLAKLLHLKSLIKECGISNRFIELCPVIRANLALSALLCRQSKAERKLEGIREDNARLFSEAIQKLIDFKPKDFQTDIYHFIDYSVATLGKECISELKELFDNTAVKEELSRNSTKWNVCFLNLVRAYGKRLDGEGDEKALDFLKEAQTFAEKRAYKPSIVSEGTLKSQFLLSHIDIELARGMPCLSEYFTQEIRRYCNEGTDLLPGLRAYIKSVVSYKEEKYLDAEKHTSEGIKELELKDSESPLSNKLGARFYLLRGSVRGYMGLGLPAITDIMEGLLRAENIKDRHIQARAYYVLGRVLLYKKLLPPKDKHNFETSKQDIFKDEDVKEAFKKAMENHEPSKPRRSLEILNRLKMEPLSIAWGLARNQEVRLQVSILHQKAHLEIEIDNYDIAEAFLVECFRLSDLHSIEQHKLNAARELIRCRLLKICQICKNGNCSSLDEKWERIKRYQDIRLESIIDYIKKTANQKKFKDSRSSKLAQFWNSMGKKLNIHDFTETSFSLKAVVKAMTQDLNEGVNLELPSLANLKSDLERFVEFKVLTSADTEIGEVLGLLEKRINSLKLRLESSN